MAKAPKSVTDPKVRFFYEHAGYAKTSNESEHQARLRNAKALADAEEYAEEHGWTYDWEEDPEAYDQLPEDAEPGEFEVLFCMLRNAEGQSLASLGGVVLRKHRGIADKYGRVVEAELALEGMPYEREGGAFEVRTAGSRGVARNASRLGELPPDPGGKQLKATMLRARGYDVWDYRGHRIMVNKSSGGWEFIIDRHRDTGRAATFEKAKARAESIVDAMEGD